MLWNLTMLWIWNMLRCGFHCNGTPINEQTSEEKKYLNSNTVLIQQKKPKKTLYDSCKDVSNPTTGAKALDLICGNWESGCNATNWIKFLTDKNINSMVPFQINAVTSLGKIYQIDYVIPYDSHE